jgi:hypothetical protein
VFVHGQPNRAGLRRSMSMMMTTILHRPQHDGNALLCFVILLISHL